MTRRKKQRIAQYFSWTLLFASFVWITNCTNVGPSNSTNDPDKLLAKVYNKSLYMSELEGMFGLNATSEDSTVIINAYVKRWIKEALLLHEAERNIPSDLNIDKLVRDYRASLIRSNYEEVILEQSLDSVITRKQLNDFYEQNKEQYELDKPIIRCLFIKVPLPVPSSKQLGRLWSSSDNAESFKNLLTYCGKHATSYLLSDSIWYRAEDLVDELPQGTVNINRLRSNFNISQRDNDFQYHFKVLEVRKKKEIAPLPFIEDQARKVILYQRRMELLEKTKEKMYEIAERKNNIQVYID